MKQNSVKLILLGWTEPWTQLAQRTENFCQRSWTVSHPTGSVLAVCRWCPVALNWRMTLLGALKGNVQNGFPNMPWNITAKTADTPADMTFSCSKVSSGTPSREHQVSITYNILSSVPVWSLFQPMVWHLSFTGCFTVTLPPLHFQITVLKMH